MSEVSLRLRSLGMQCKFWLEVPNANPPHHFFVVFFPEADLSTESCCSQWIKIFQNPRRSDWRPRPMEITVKWASLDQSVTIRIHRYVEEKGWTRDPLIRYCDRWITMRRQFYALRVDTNFVLLLYKNSGFTNWTVRLNGLVVSALEIRTRGRFDSRVVPLFHWVATLGKLFTHIASPVSLRQETAGTTGSFRRLSGYGD